MGLFNVSDPITEEILIGDGWIKSNQWGAPAEWGPKSEHFMKYIHIKVKNTSHTIEMIFFPETFDVYTNLKPDPELHQLNRIRRPKSQIYFAMVSSSDVMDYCSATKCEDLLTINMEIERYKTFFENNYE